MLLTTSGVTVELLLKYVANYWWCYCSYFLSMLLTTGGVIVELQFSF